MKLFALLLLLPVFAFSQGFPSTGALPFPTAGGGSWTYTTSHTIKAGQITGTQSGFTALLPLIASPGLGVDSHFATVANGGVIQHTVTDPYGQTVPADLVVSVTPGDTNCATPAAGWILVGWNQTTGSVQIHAIGSFAVGTIMYECAGSSSQTTWAGGAAGAAVDANTFAYYPFGSASALSYVDYSTNGCTLTPVATPTAGTNEFGGGALTLDGMTQAGQNTSCGLPGSTNLTMHIWLNPVSTASIGSPLSLDASATGNVWFNISSGVASFAYNGVSPQATPINNSTWQALDGVVDSGVSNGTVIYLNGAAGGMGTATALGAQSGIFVGEFYTGGLFFFDGLLSTVRIDTTNRSANWIAAVYNMESAPTSFWT